MNTVQSKKRNSILDAPLTPQESEKLIQEYRQFKNLIFQQSIIYSRISGGILLPEDFHTDAVKALVYLVRSFDPTKGFAKISYLHRTMTTLMYRTAKNSSFIKVSEDVRFKIGKVNKKYLAEFGRLPTAEEIIVETKLKTEQVQGYFTHTNQVQSLSDFVPGQDELTWGTSIANKTSLSPQIMAEVEEEIVNKGKSLLVLAKKHTPELRVQFALDYYYQIKPLKVMMEEEKISINDLLMSIGEAVNQYPDYFNEDFLEGVLRYRLHASSNDSNLLERISQLIDIEDFILFNRGSYYYKIFQDDMIRMGDRSKIPLGPTRIQIQAIFMYFFENKKLESVGAELGVTKQAIDTRIQKAKAHYSFLETDDFIESSREFMRLLTRFGHEGRLLF